jgi:hypothetical protein
MTHGSHLPPALGLVDLDARVADLEARVAALEAALRETPRETRRETETRETAESHLRLVRLSLCLTTISLGPTTPRALEKRSSHDNARAAVYQSRVALRCATSEAIWRSGHARRWCALSDCGGSRQKPNDRWRGDVDEIPEYRAGREARPTRSHATLSRYGSFQTALERRSRPWQADPRRRPTDIGFRRNQHNR